MRIGNDTALSCVTTWRPVALRRNIIFHTAIIIIFFLHILVLKARFC